MQAWQQWTEMNVSLETMEGRLQIIFPEYYESYGEDQCNEIKKCCSSGNIAGFLAVITVPVENSKVSTFLESLIAIAHIRRDSDSFDQQQNVESTKNQEGINHDHDPQEEQGIIMLCVSAICNLVARFVECLKSIPSCVYNNFQKLDEWLFNPKKNDYC